MAMTRAALILAPLLLLGVGAAAAVPSEEEVPLAADDECLASDEGCEMSLRQLRASAKEGKELAAAPAKPSEKETGTVARHDHEEAKQVAQPAAATPTTVVDTPAAKASLAGTNATVMGSCSTDDEAKMARLGGGNADGTFPKITSECGHEAYRWFSFHQDRMRSCMTRRTGISESCANCFVQAGQYGVDHCKLQCLFGAWCGSGCLTCNRDGNNQARQCAGVTVPDTHTC